MKTYISLILSHKKYVLLFCLLLVMNVAKGQIKIVGDEIMEQIQPREVENQELEKDVSIEKYFIPFDSIKFDTKSYNPSPVIFRKLNPVGLKFYITTPNDCVQLCVNPSDSTICFKQLQTGYYEITGVIRFAEQVGVHFKNILNYRITGSVNYKKRPSAEYLQDFFSNQRFQTAKEIEKDILNNELALSAVIYTIANDKGEVFYIWSDGGPSTSQHGLEVKQGTFYEDYSQNRIDVPFYEMVAKRLIGEKVIITDYRNENFTDALTGQEIKDKNPFVEIHKTYTQHDVWVINGLLNEKSELSSLVYDSCVDVFVKGEDVYGFFERDNSKFALKIYNIAEAQYACDQSDKRYQKYYAAFKNLDCFVSRGSIMSGDLKFIIPIDVIQQVQNGAIALNNAIRLDQEREEALARAEREQKAAAAEKRRLEALALAEKERAEAEAKAKREAEEAKARKQQRRERILEKYGKRFGDLIIQGKVALGMTEEMCLAAWGHPWDKYNETTVLGTSSVWIYNYKTALYFKLGRLVKIEN